jgi:2-polyprenyl-6-methoxyphenol hydroxylase-like FAD-dependent oxidoreductase
MAGDNRILIVGGGIGGMAAAIRLAELGRPVELIDLDPDWRVYGAGITITGPTLRAYRDLGLLEAIKAQGAISNRTRMFAFNGHHIKDMDEPALEDGLPATGGIMRPVLHRIMQARVRDLNVAVRLGITVDALQQLDDGVDVTFSDGSNGRYALVIGADSVHSRVRELAFPAMQPPQHTGQGCWRISIAKPPMLETGEFYFGHRFPVGITVCADDRVYMWMLTPHIRRPNHFTEAELYDNLKSQLADFGGSAGWIRDHMTRDDFINYRPLAAVIQPAPWFGGRVTLVGDAVHATTPHLASGAGMAVESAIVLADAIGAHADMSAALKAYQERRFERCRLIVESSIAIGAAQLDGASAEQVGGMIGQALHRLAAPY